MILDETNAWGVVNAAGYVLVDQAEVEREVCERVNTLAPLALAEACGRHGLPLLTFSSDLVFDGRAKGTPYTESQPVAPLNVYGESKARMESGVLDAAPKALVVRTSAFFGPWDEANFVTQTLASLAEGKHVKAAQDQTVSPTYVPDLAHAALDLLVDRETGIWHLANQGAVTWSDLAELAAGMAALPAKKVVSCSSAELGFVAPRPAWSVLSSERGFLMPSLEDALTRYFADRKDPERFRKAA